MKRYELNVTTGELSEVEQVVYSINGQNRIVQDLEQTPPEGSSIVDISAIESERIQNDVMSEKFRFSDFVQSYLDSHAQSWGYDNIHTAVTYAEEPSVEQFQLEGKALRAWRSQVWAKGYQILAEVQAGERPIPSEAEILAELPSAPVKP